MTTSTGISSWKPCTDIFSSDQSRNKVYSIRRKNISRISVFSRLATAVTFCYCCDKRKFEELSHEIFMFQAMFFALSLLFCYMISSINEANSSTEYFCAVWDVINVDIYTSDIFRNAPLSGWLSNIFFGVTFNVNAMKPFLNTSTASCDVQ